MKKGRIIAVFGGSVPHEASVCEEIINGIKLRTFIGPGSIYEATALLEQLPKIKLQDGTAVAQLLTYKGYELWWIHITDTFRYFCLPYTQYSRLLEYLKDFGVVYLSDAPYENLFRCYLEAYGCKVIILGGRRAKSPSLLPFGVFIQIMLTLLSLPILILRKLPVLVYTGDKLDQGRDFDFRMRFIYEELRKRGISFMEFIRGVEPWDKVLEHAWIRKRPVVYSEAIIFIARLADRFLKRSSVKVQNRKFEAFQSDPKENFKFRIATQFLLTAREDIIATRIMSLILRWIGVKVAFIPGVSERNWHTLIGCKINGIRSVGIMHGVQSKYYNHTDFLPGYKSGKDLGLDKYGVWSSWWKDYYKNESKLYSPEDLHISGPMRPLSAYGHQKYIHKSEKLAVLFVSEEMAVPEEVLPFLEALMKENDLDLLLKFRPSRDGFENWLRTNRPDILGNPRLKIVRGNMAEAMLLADVATGCQSTGVIESLFFLRVPIYFYTKKWGDYFNLKNYGKESPFFAKTPEELIVRIKNVARVPKDILRELQERYFGDPHRNGSKWVIDQIEDVLNENE